MVWVFTHCWRSESSLSRLFPSPSGRHSLHASVAVLNSWAPVVQQRGPAGPEVRLTTSFMTHQSVHHEAWLPQTELSLSSLGGSNCVIFTPIAPKLNTEKKLQQHSHNGDQSLKLQMLLVRTAQNRHDLCKIFLGYREVRLTETRT